MLTPEQAATRNSIQSAQDVEVEAVSEGIPGTSLNRVERRTWTSASVGNRYTEFYLYMKPASSPEWGALAGVNEIMEAL